jgi:hypothetical protein
MIKYLIELCRFNNWALLCENTLMNDKLLFVVVKYKMLQLTRFVIGMREARCIYTRTFGM